MHLTDSSNQIIQGRFTGLRANIAKRDVDRQNLSNRFRCSLDETNLVLAVEQPPRQASCLAVQLNK